MCHKVIATYQQTFQNTNDLTRKSNFRFNRIYKSKPEQFFRVKCVGLSSIDESSKYNVLSNPTHSGEMYLSGLQALNKNCNFKNATEEDNRLYLGDLNGSIPDSVFIVDSIPLDNFTIYNSNHDGLFTVCFHIELIEP